MSVVVIGVEKVFFALSYFLAQIPIVECGPFLCVLLAFSIGRLNDCRYFLLHASFLPAAYENVLTKVHGPIYRVRLKV